MRDLPVFTTQNGVAGLVLREIPYKGVAYITLHDTCQPEALLCECVDFCVMAGAKHIFATGHVFLEQYPLSAELWKMERPWSDLCKTLAESVPVTEETAEQWRALYNEKMAPVPNGATMTREDMKKLLGRKAGYYVYKEGELLGIGIAAGDTVESVIGAMPGAGEEVLLTLCGVLRSDKVGLEVASTNLPAVRLYQRLGFEKSAVLSRWYCIKSDG